MKLNSLFLGSLAAMSMLFAQSCGEKNDEPTGAPSIELSESAVEFGQASDTKVVTVTSTRDWKATSKVDWVAVEPASGKATNGTDVTVSVLENTGMDRTGTVEFTIGFDTKTLTVNQKGTGSASELVVYHNDFDKELAVKESSGWKTYLDSFEGWKNETGSGIAAVEYAFNGMSARTSSGASNSSYSDYEGSGQNYLWFAKDAYFEVKNIALPENSVNYALSFGSERNEYNAADNTFNPSEFLVYVSNDGSKWVALEYAFPGELKNRRWDKATATFTVPSGTSALYIYVKATIASAYLFDDLDLSVASAAGTAIDFSKGIDLGTGGDTPGTGTDYTKAESKTVAEFIAAADKATYYKLKGTVSGYNATYCSFDLTDATGTIYVYSTANKDEWSSKVKDGGTVELAGLYDYYDSKSQHEVVKAQILSFTEGETPTPTPGGSTIAEIAAGSAGASVDLKDMLVTGVTTQSYVITDNTGSILVFAAAAPGVKVGDKVNVTGTTGTHNGLMQIASPTTTVASSGNAVTYPEPKVIDESNMASYSSSVVEYVSFKGNVAKSGNYYNIYVGSITNKDFSLSYWTGDIASLEGKDVEVKGWYVGGGNHYQVVAVDVKEAASSTPRFSVSADALTAKADDTSITFDVKGNVNWTVASDNTAYTVSPASGEGDGTVTVSFSANAAASDVKVNIMVSTTADVATKSYTVVLTHQGTATVEADYSSNVKWTGVTNAYATDKVTVNGGKTQFAALKLGKGSAVGSATMVIPAGTKKISFYAYAWKGKTASLSFKVGETALGSDIALKANDGCTSTSPYALVNVSESDMYTIDVTALNGGNALAADVTVTVESVKGSDYRAVIFAVNAE